jgi:ubiquinone/menaquinone biosynthesis C-methylase UbiE
MHPLVEQKFMHPRLDYDTVADAYDRRYLRNDYSGVENAVTALVASNRDVRVLEVGCGTGHWLRVLADRSIRVAGLDASIRMLAHAQAHAHCPVVLGVAEQLPWARASFDRVFCVNALHHFQNKDRFLAEARRVVRPGGQLMTVGLDPHTGIDQWYVYEYFDRTLETDKRRYLASSQIRDWMHVAGFVDCETREVQHVPARLLARTALEQGRLEKTATSQLSVLTDEQYEQGIDRIRTDMAAADARGDSLYLTADLRLYATLGSVPL